MAEKSSHPLHVVHFNPITPVQDTLLFAEQNTNHSGALTVPDTVTEVQDAQVFAEQNTNHSGTLTVPHTEQTTTGTIMKLTSPAKVVNVPVAGQPGRFLVGLLPVPDISQPEKVEKPTAPGKKNYLKKNSKIIGLALLVVILLGTGALWFTHQLSSSKTPAVVTIVKTPDLRATMAAQATETAEANIILSDPLNSISIIGLSRQMDP